MRRGFTMLEMVFVLAIMGLILLAFVKWVLQTSDNAMVKEEYLNAYRFEAGIKNSFIAVLDTFEGVCGNIPSDATSSMAWGWAGAGCTGTSPLPTRSGNSLVYSIDFGSLSAGMQTSLKNKIAAAYAPMCVVSGSTATSLTLYCGPSFTDFQYDTAGGLVNRYHTPGTNLDMIDTPIPVLTITRRYAQGNQTETKTYRLNMADVWQQRMAHGIDKMTNVAKMLKNLYNLKLARETANTAPAGLNSIDDELTPWFWVAFGDDAGAAATTICAKNTTTGVCDNLDIANIWRSTTGDALLWRRLIAGVAGGDFKYTVDGFGNPLRLYPILSQCGNTNLGLCSAVTAPSSPREPYPISATIKPPYTSLIYSTVVSGGVNCADTSTQAPLGCRYPIVY